MAKSPKKSTDDERSPEEVERIESQTLKKLLSTPPRPYTKKVGGRSKGKPNK